MEAGPAAFAADFAPRRSARLAELALRRVEARHAQAAAAPTLEDEPPIPVPEAAPTYPVGVAAGVRMLEGKLEERPQRSLGDLLTVLHCEKGMPTDPRVAVAVSFVSLLHLASSAAPHAPDAARARCRGAPRPRRRASASAPAKPMRQGALPD